MTRTNLHRILTTAFMAASATAAFAQDASDQRTRKADADKMIGAESGAYTISLAGYRNKDLVLCTVPVKSWTNDLNGEFYGSVFIWTLNGRPQVVGSLYRSFSPYNYFAAELTSLCEHELLATNDEAIVWQPPAGVKFQRVPDGGRPSETRPGRLIQMRSIARRFVGQLTDEEKVRRTLLISPQPLYRYKKTSNKLLDGALFSLVNGTDPEVLLLLEVRHMPQGFQWQYGLGRLSTSELRVTCDGEAVWNAAPVEWPYTRLSESYTILRREIDAVE